MIISKVKIYSPKTKQPLPPRPLPIYLRRENNNNKKKRIQQLLQIQKAKKKKSRPAPSIWPHRSSFFPPPQKSANLITLFTLLPDLLPDKPHISNLCFTNDKRTSRFTSKRSHYPAHPTRTSRTLPPTKQPTPLCRPSYKMVKRCQPPTDCCWYPIACPSPSSALTMDNTPSPCLREVW